LFIKAVHILERRKGNSSKIEKKIPLKYVTTSNCGTTQIRIITYLPGVHLCYWTVSVLKSVRYYEDKKKVDKKTEDKIRIGHPRERK